MIGILLLQKAFAGSSKLKQTVGAKFLPVVHVKRPQAICRDEKDLRRRCSSRVESENIRNYLYGHSPVRAMSLIVFDL